MLYPNFKKSRYCCKILMSWNDLYLKTQNWTAMKTIKKISATLIPMATILFTVVSGIGISELLIYALAWQSALKRHIHRDSHRIQQQCQNMVRQRATLCRVELWRQDAWRRCSARGLCKIMGESRASFCRERAWIPVDRGATLPAWLFPSRRCRLSSS